MTTQKHIYFIDAGHAPDTPGKRSPKLPPAFGQPQRQLLEWEFNRDVVRRICKHLSARGIANHELTPHTDEDMGPTARAQLANELANELELDAFLVSVHANAAGMGGDWHEAHGVTVLHYPGSKAGEALAVRFLNAIVEATGWRDRGVKGRGDLSILKKTHMPAILTENGFYTHEQQCRALLTDEFRERIAMAHVEAIVAIELADVVV